jgi:hypothetical protein
VVQGLADGFKIQALLERTRGQKDSWAARSIGHWHLVPFAEQDGRHVPLHWHLQDVRQADHRLTMKFVEVKAQLEARSEWVGSAGPGPVEHTVTIVNKGQQDWTLPLQPTLAWTFSTSRTLDSWWIEKGAGRPSTVGEHVGAVSPHSKQVVLTEPYMSDERAYSPKGDTRSPIPWLGIFDRSHKSGLYAGMEFSGRTSIELTRDARNNYQLTLGIAKEPKGQPAFQTRLRAGTSYVLPTAFVGCFEGTVDDGCNHLKRWIDSNLRPRAADPRYPLLTLNSWGSGFAIDAPLGHSMVSNAAKLGLEMFHVDAGWFKGVGDWRANQDKFPNGIDKMADDAHAHGLKFGLWVGWTQGGIMPDQTDRDQVMNVHAPDRVDWFAQDHDAAWKPSEFVGADLCLGSDQATAWCKDLLIPLVQRYHLDMLEHDQRMIVDSCVRTDHEHTRSSGDTAYWATLGYYSVYDTVRKHYPQLMFENCVNGGRMVDFGAAKRASYFSIADSYFPLANRRAFWDTSYLFPPCMCECYVEAVKTKNLDEFRSMLRSGLMGWFTLMQDPAKWSPAEFAAAREEFKTYKTKLRPLIRHADLFHISARPDGVNWDGVEYATRDKDHGVIFAFRGTTSVGSHRFHPKGLNAKAVYAVHFKDPVQSDFSATGSQIMSKGLVVNLEKKESSQLVFFKLKSRS